MHSSSSFGGAYIHYEVEVICPNCGRVGEIKLSKSRDNPERLFYKCSQCGKFIKWVSLLQDGARVSAEDQRSKDMTINELKEIKLLLKDINGRIFLGLMVMLAMLVVIGTSDFVVVLMT